LGLHNDSRGCIRVLTYHRFGGSPRDPFCLEPELFEEQMSFLSSSRRAISLPEFANITTGSECHPDGAVLVTIDDGHFSLYDKALPIIKRYEIPVVAFVAAGLIGCGSSDCTRFNRHMNWSELRDLTSAGITIGSHGWMHCSLGRSTLARAVEEALRSRMTLEDRLGIAVSAFAYPYGTRADFTPFTRRLLQKCGYTHAFVSQHGFCRADQDPYTIPRIKIEGAERLWMYNSILSGGLDGWRWVDRWFWRLQAVTGNSRDVNLLD
jgi:peptidoglycan/xylan/chitin deacetylase (PgdA/CDA1 family)